MAGKAACKLLVGNADGTEVKPLQQVMVSKVIDDILVSHAMATPTAVEPAAPSGGQLRKRGSQQRSGACAAQRRG